MLGFAEALRLRNRDLKTRELSRSKVTSQYVTVVLQEYSTEEPEGFELLGQVRSHPTCQDATNASVKLDSPAFNTYWDKVTKDELVLQPKQEIEGTSCRIITRKLPPGLSERYPHCVVLQSKTLGSVIFVPNIFLRGIQRIAFKEAVRLVLGANTSMDYLPTYLREIWAAIIRGVYHFEDAEQKAGKLEEVCCTGLKSMHSRLLADFWGLL